MKILFDQGTPVSLRRHLLEHSVTTVYEQGWSHLLNGRLLEAAEQEGYGLLITTDQNLHYQQNSGWTATCNYRTSLNILGRVFKTVLWQLKKRLREQEPIHTKRLIYSSLYNSALRPNTTLHPTRSVSAILSISGMSCSSRSRMPLPTSRRG